LTQLYRLENHAEVIQEDIRGWQNEQNKDKSIPINKLKV
jgi:hypothetical protein